MTKKVKKAVKAQSSAVQTTDRWTVRGVPGALQKSAGDAARAKGLTLGRYLSEVLERALGASARTSPVDVDWQREVEGRLARLERALDPSDLRPANPHAAVVGATER